MVSRNSRFLPFSWQNLKSPGNEAKTDIGKNPGVACILLLCCFCVIMSLNANFEFKKMIESRHVLGIHFCSVLWSQGWGFDHKKHKNLNPLFSHGQ